ncbi:hypothetical protein GGQ99_000980 [Aminobacter niigataensis]|uniref:Methyltransferase n=1 Tax=Aminobacter niigataensis TaxID=83265 RepID=A0ABR6KXW7_9HYPH|nr:SAM-dependent methyltransferase [Aminobacter niigataensis]MBB4649258.1 hypothetical protein [Aminobacter niigataensis]
MNARTHSTAVMARRVEPADSLDFFPTPPWATRAFCEHVLQRIWFGPTPFDCTVEDPACGEGHMALALAEYFTEARASDIFGYGYGAVQDFLHPDHRPTGVDWFITNPPFNLALDFVEKALTFARRGVAMLVRTQFQEGEERFERLFSRRPPQWIAQHVERVPMHRGRWVVNGTSATAYQWLIWFKHPAHRDIEVGTRFMWIPKSRRTWSRHDDWLRFGGCWDLPKEHKALQLQDRRYLAPALTLAEVRAEMQGALL